MSRIGAGFIKLGIVTALAASLAASVASAESIAIESDKTILMRISAKPGTVVVGNPSIADVSINGEQIFLHGHGYGNTNIIILDNKGGQIANFDVTVKQAATDSVTLFRGSDRYSMACAPECEFVLQPGDNPEWFKAIVEQQASKNSLATGSETTEAQAPAAPQ
jgi:hypothetical protein